VIPHRLRGLLFFIVAAALAIAFAWQGSIASFGDDSASYLTLAHYFSPSGSAVVTQWAGYHSNFPPLFPMLLALTGGAHDLHVAHVLVGVCAAIGTALFYRYAVWVQGERAGLVVAVLFLFTATAWVSLKGVLSESLFLLVSIAALLFHEMRIASRRPAAWEWLVFGILVACVALTRAIGILLVAAYVMHLLVRFMGKEKPSRAALLPLVPVVALLGLWYVLRPRAPIDYYQYAVSWVIGVWLENPLDTLVGASRIFFDGWIHSFLADSEATVAAKVVFAGLGLLAIAGALIRTARNQLDGWFAILSLAVVFSWTFSPETTRRLLYPSIPLLILFAALAVRQALGATQLAGRGLLLAQVALTALPVLLCLPAILLIREKALDHRAVIAGCPQAFREMTPYYTTLNIEGAEGLARLEVMMLCGLQSLDKVTPPGSVVMWTRPEYVALLGHRPAAAYHYAWSPRDLAMEIRRSKVDYLVVSLLNKNDLEGGLPKPLKGMQEEAYAQPVFASTDNVFVVKKIDRAALERFLEQ